MESDSASSSDEVTQFYKAALYNKRPESWPQIPFNPQTIAGGILFYLGLLSSIAIVQLISMPSDPSVWFWILRSVQLSLIPIGAIITIIGVFRE